MELVLLIIAERMLNPVIDLVSNSLTGGPLSKNVLVLGIAGLIVIIVASILGVILAQHAYRWIKAANRAMQTKGMAQVKPEQPEPASLSEGLAFFPSRKGLPTSDDLIKTAQSNIDLLGFTLETWSVMYRAALRKALKDGRHFRFILLSPASKSIKEADELNQRIDLQGRISGSLRMLQTIKSELSDVERGRLDIRIHDLLPVHSIVAIDAESESGVIYVEYYVYGTDPNSWVSLRISKKEQAALFDKYWQSYKYVWERSKTWP